MRRTYFENAAPILNVANMSRSLKFYVGVLGFVNAQWGSEDFTSVTRDNATIYLCKGAQGQPGTWVWIGVEDVAVLYDAYRKTATVRDAPRNFPWAYEMKLEDPDGHVLRFGSEPRSDLPFDEPWLPAQTS